MRTFFIIHLYFIYIYIMNKKIKIISIYEIIWWIIGLAIITFSLSFLFSALRGDLYLVSKIFICGIYIYTIIWYSLSIYSGVLLLKEKRKWISLSMINQIIQIPYFLIWGFSYLFFSWFWLLIWFHSLLWKLSFNFFLGSKFEILYDYETSWYIIWINIFALFVLYFLLKYKKEQGATS